MNDYKELTGILEELIDVVHSQAKELEKLVDHIEQVSGRKDYISQFSIIASHLSGLHVRIKKLQADGS